MPGAKLHCPVDGCGERSDRWGNKSYPLPSLDVFTLQLSFAIDLSINNRICQPCWERHRHHTMKLDGRIRVHPIASPSPLDALLSAAISPLPSAPVSVPSPPSLSSLPSPPLTPARVLASIQPPTTVPTPPRRTHSFPPVLDLSPAPSTYSERQRDVVASVMAGIDYERYRLQQVMQGGTPMAKSTWYEHQSTVYNSIRSLCPLLPCPYTILCRTP